MVNPISLLNFAGNYQTITSFVSGGGIAELLSKLGDSTLEAALQNLRSVPSANDKKATIQRATTQLEIALETYFKSVAVPQKFSQVASSIINDRDREKTIERFRIVVCCLAICYTYLNEIKRREGLIDRYNKWVDEERESFPATPLNVLGLFTGIALGIFNPNNFSDDADNEVTISVDMSEFIKQIESVKVDPYFKLVPRVKVAHLKADTTQTPDTLTLDIKMNFYGYVFLAPRVNLWFTTFNGKFVSAPAGSRYADRDGDIYAWSYTQPLQFIDSVVTYTFRIPLDQFPSGRSTIYPQLTVYGSDNKDRWLLYGRQQGSPSILIRR